MATKTQKAVRQADGALSLFVHAEAQLGSAIATLHEAAGDHETMVAHHTACATEARDLAARHEQARQKIADLLA